MLDDRSYMRTPQHRPGPGLPAWAILMIVNVGAFMLQMFLSFNEGASLRFHKLFALSTYGISHGFVWQLITFQFLHGGMFHLLGNMIGLYFFGRFVEETFGRSSFLKMYLWSGMLGGVLQVLAGFAFRDIFGGMVLGASAGVMALIAAFATAQPYHRITLLIFFVLPVSFQARFILWGAIFLTGMGIVGAFAGGAHSGGAQVADWAHAGGIIGGIVFIKCFVQGSGLERFPLLKYLVSGAFFRRGLRPRVSVGGARRRPPRMEVVEEDDTPEDISRQVDPILDKISQHGIQSLTARERKILEKARDRMAGR